MQLYRELVDVAGYFSALRFVLGQLASNFVRVGQSVRGRFLRLRNGRQLAAFLAGQHQAGGRPIRDQRSFAMLAMKENVALGCDFAERMFRRFHDQITSRACASGTEVPNPREASNTKLQNVAGLIVC